MLTSYRPLGAIRTVWELQEAETSLKAVVGVDPFRVGQLCMRAMMHAIGELSEGRSFDAIPRYVVQPVLLTHDSAKHDNICCSSDVAEVRPELPLRTRT